MLLPLERQDLLVSPFNNLELVLFEIEELNNNNQINIINGDKYCEDCDWDEMSYKHYCQKLLDFSFDEYANGDWSLD